MKLRQYDHSHGVALKMLGGKVLQSNVSVLGGQGKITIQVVVEIIASTGGLQCLNPFTYNDLTLPK